jgi:hypothetical protein
MVIDSAGNVGIGTTSPSNSLTISLGSGISNVIPALGVNGGAMGMFADAQKYGLIEGVLGNGNVFMQAQRVDATAVAYNLLLQPNGGSVGIGTTAPTYKLDVRGTAISDGIRSAMGFDIYQVPDPTAPTGVVSSGGSVDTGAHWYSITYTTAIGETHPTYTAAQITTTAGNNTVTLTIPVSTDPRVTGRKIYRTKAGDSQSNDYYLATISDNTTTTYVDTLADSSLAGTVGAGYFRMNTTSKNVTVNGTSVMTLDSRGTIVGYGAGKTTATGGRYTIVGKNAGVNLTTGSDNNLFGENAGAGITTGSANHLF